VPTGLPLWKSTLRTTRTDCKNYLDSLEDAFNAERFPEQEAGINRWVSALFMVMSDNEERTWVGGNLLSQIDLAVMEGSTYIYSILRLFIESLHEELGEEVMGDKRVRDVTDLHSLMVLAENIENEMSTYEKVLLFFGKCAES
jgi:hypothetical protein